MKIIIQTQIKLLPEGWYIRKSELYQYKIHKIWNLIKNGRLK